MSGDAMSKIMGSIHTAVNEKVENGELNKDSMVNEAQGLYKNMGSNPLFQAMDQMHGQGRQQQQQQQQQQQPKPSNKTQARLQKKLKEKQKIQVNKVDE
jgi:membrane protease subunit (stomatin/prohibitin family)